MTEKLASVLLRSLAAWDGLPDRLRPPLLRRSGVSIGERSLIKSGVRFAKFAKVALADDVYINHDCYFDAEAPITIASNVSVADHARFITATHMIGPTEDRAGAHYGKEIIIGEGTWIGSSVVILPGVVVGKGCVIAAGAVVTNDCESDSLYAGIPARRIRSL